MKKLTDVQRSMIEAAGIAFVPKAERAGLPSRRTIHCRGCDRWMNMNRENRRWFHEDGTLACLDPETMKPYTSDNNEESAR